MKINVRIYCVWGCRAAKTIRFEGLPNSVFLFRLFWKTLSAVDVQFKWKAHSTQWWMRLISSFRFIRHSFRTALIKTPSFMFSSCISMNRLEVKIFSAFYTAVLKPNEKGIVSYYCQDCLVYLCSCLPEATVTPAVEENKQKVKQQQFSGSLDNVSSLVCLLVLKVNETLKFILLSHDSYFNGLTHLLLFFWIFIMVKGQLRSFQVSFKTSVRSLNEHWNFFPLL